jgi:DNA repair protein RecO (recombination protein O)
MLLQTRGIVFRTIKYGETSVIADIFTEAKGLHTFIAGGVRSAKARMPFGLFQPMTVVDLVCYYKDAPDAVNRLKEMRVAEVFGAIPFDIRRGAIALFMAEVCRKSIHEAEENPDLFEFLLDYLLLLDATDKPLANLHLHFLLGLSGFFGFQPQGEPDTDETFFDLKEGLFSPVPPLHPLFLEPAQTRFMLDLLRLPAERFYEPTLTRIERKILLMSLLQFYALHMPGFSEIHTPEVLELVMQG